MRGSNKASNGGAMVLPVNIITFAFNFAVDKCCVLQLRIKNPDFDARACAGDLLRSSATILRKSSNDQHDRDQ